MTTVQLLRPEFSGIDDLTLAEVEAKLKEHQQLLQALLQTPGSMLSYLPQNDAVSLLPTEVATETTPDHQELEAELLFQQALRLSEQEDFHQAASLYCRAAYTGHVRAQVQLAHGYLKGAGVPKSAVFAYSWFLLAALQQDGSAEQACTVLCKHLSVHDQQQAQQLAAERFEKITMKNNK